MKKRLLSILLTFCLALTLLPVTALADDGTFTANITVGGNPVSCTFKVLTAPADDNSGTVQLGMGGDYTNTVIPKTSAGALVIPAQVTNGVSNFDVTAIAANAFYGCSGLTGDLTIPTSVTSIGVNAFNNCWGFNGALTIPDSVKSIGNSAFMGCSGFTGNLTIPDSVTSMGEYAFYNCSGFNGALTIGSGVTSIGNCTFYGCNMLTGSLTIPDLVTSIGDSAFSGCSGFTGDLTIGAEVRTIGKNAFYQCSKLAGTLTIGTKVESIGELTFYECINLSGSLSIPDSVTSIGQKAFYGCSGFKDSLTISKSITSIEDAVFAGCTGFTGSLAIPDSVTSIGNSVFSGCSGFNGSLTIPNSVKEIQGWAFNGCSGFTGTLTIPSEVTSIGASTFEKCSGFTGSLNIPSKVTSIGNRAFINCSGFDGSLTIPSGVTLIGDSAFSGCTGFTGNLIIPSGVTSIGESAFSSCSKFTGDLTIPGSVKTIGIWAFNSCQGLTGSLTIEPGVEVIKQGAFNHCRFHGNLEIPNTVTTIELYAFMHCWNFDGTLTIPDSVTTIGESAFYGCTRLTGDLIIPDSVTSIGDGAFSGCAFNGTLTISDSVTSIGASTFSYCEFTGTLTIPDSVTSIGANAFDNSPFDTVSFLSSVAPSVGSNSFPLAHLIFYPKEGTGYNVSPWIDEFKDRLYPDTYTQEPQPNATFTATGWNSGTLSNVESGMQYQIGYGGWIAIDSSAISLNNLTTYTIQVVRKGNGTTTLDSFIQKINVTRAEAPTTVEAVGCTTLLNQDGKLTGVTKEMEYKLSTKPDSEWKGGSGSDIADLKAGTYYVRVKAANTMLASGNQILKIAEFTGEPVAAPNATFTATGPDSGTLSNVESGMQYQIGDGGWIAIDSSADISLNILAPCTIKVVRKGNGTTTTNSAAQTIEITRAATPSLKETQPNVIGGTGSIPMTAEHEYSTDNGATWKPAESGPLAAGVYLVRVKAVTTVLASNNQEITLIAFTGKLEEQPNATFTAAGPDSGTLSNVESGMQYQIGDKGWIAIDSSAISLNGLTPCTIKVVRKGNGTTTTDSAAQAIEITQPSAPTGIGKTDETWAKDDGKLTGVDSTMEYKLSDADSYTAITGTTVDGLKPGEYLARVKAANTALASPDTTVTIAAFVKGTPGASDLTYDLTSVTFDGSAKPLAVSKKTAGIGDITVKYDGSTSAPTNPGTYNVTADIAENEQYNEVKGLGLGDYTINKATVPAALIDNVSVRYNDTGEKTHSLTGLPANMETASYAQDTVTGETGNLNTSSVDPSTGAVTYCLSDGLSVSDVGETITIPVIVTSQNYEDFTVNVVITVSDKADGPGAPSVSFSFDGADANKLMGATTLMEYSLDGEGTWHNCTENMDLTDSLTSIIDTNDIKVRLKATDTHAAGAVNTINITKATTPTSPAATDADVSGKGTLTGVTTDMEYQKSGGTVWITGTGSTISLDPGTYYVRVKAAGTKLASDNQTLTIGIFVKGTPTVADLSYDLSAATYDGYPKSVTVTKVIPDIGDLTVIYKTFYDIMSKSPPVNAGSYSVIVNIAGNEKYNPVDGLSLGNFVINKAEYSGDKIAPATVRANRSENNLTVTLPALPDGASYAASGTVGGSNPALIASHSIDGTTLRFSTASKAATSATITIPVTEAINYQDYNVVVTITAVDKEIVTIDGLTAATDLVYNGTAQKGYTGTVAVSDNKVHSSELLYTYTSTDGGGYNAATAPTDAGAYKLVVSVADTNGDYTGAHADITFTIAKATITVTAKDKSAYVGDTAPVLGDDDYTVTGLVSGETLKTKPTIAYASAPDMTKTGTMAINITGTVAPDGGNYNAIIHKEGVLTISNRPSSGGGGSYTPPAPVTKIDNGGSVTGSNLDRLISGEKTLTVDGDNGAKLVFGTEALKGIDGQTSGNIKVEMKDVSTDYQDRQPGKIVFSLTLTSGDKTITDFGGSATVSLPYELKDGETAADVNVWYLAGDGVMTEVPCSYNPVTKLATFTVTHFSLYVVGVDTPWVNPFTDVAASDWFYGALEFANRNSLFAGTGAATFSPNRPMTRAMLWTVLARLDGQSLSGSGVFDAARSWAMGAGITDGTNPDGSITREQMVTILWRYAGSPKVDSGLSEFSDVGSVASYAADAMAWAVENGMIAGANGALMPQGNATRAQVATILQRFIEATAK